MEDNETLPDFPVVTHVEPIPVAVQPPMDATHEKLAHLQDAFTQLAGTLGEISGKLDGLTARIPEPVAPPVQSQEPETEEVADKAVDAVPDAVTLTVDDKPSKPPKIQPQDRKRRGFRKR